ncbi:MAG TPA: hypothetical protein VJB05_03780 [archaeon]|nr:hypothetical protein [archaeon]
MDEQELHEYLKDRQALEVMRDLCHQLNMTQPDGATIHSRRKLGVSFDYHAYHYEHGFFPVDETFSGYRDRDEVGYAHMIKEIARAIREFHVTI